MENYHLSVTGDASSLKAELEKISQVMDSLESKDAGKGLDNWADKLKEIEELTKNVSKAFEKNKNNTVMPYKEVEQVGKAAIDATVHMNDLKKAIDNISKNSKLKGLDIDVEANKALQSIQREIDNTRKQATQLTGLKISPDASIKDMQRDMKLFGEETKRTTQQYKEFTNMKANFTRDRRDFAEANRINQGGMTTGSVTYNDRQRLNNHMEKRADYLTRARSFRRQNNEDREQIRNNQSKISDLMNTEQTPETKEKIAMIKNETEAIQKNIAERNKEAEAYRSMAQELKGMQSTMGQYDTKAQRGSFRATLEDRAPSIGMAAVGGTLAFGASSYMKGKTTNQNLRDDMFFRGNLFGNSDYREVRRNMFENSIDNGYGYDAEATNSMAKSYLSFNEQTDSEDELNKGVTQFQRSGRALNIDRELMEDSYSNIGKTGGITGSSDLGSFTNTFVGALDKSKMSARSEEQLKSLDSMVSLMGQNRTLSNDDVTNAVAMQSMMASTGSKALQGEKGANAINNMSQSMQGGINDPLMLQMMGYGSDFTGQAGRLKAQAQLEKGATYDNINRIMEYTGGGVNAQEVLVNKMGVSTEQAKAFTDMYANGDLTKESFDNYKQELKEKGKDKADKDSSSVKDSEENELNRSTQKKEYQDSKTADNFSWIEKAQGAMASLNNAGYLLMGAAAALVASAATSIGMAGGATAVRKVSSRLGRTKTGGKIKNSKFGQATGEARDKAKRWWNDGGDSPAGTGTGGGNPKPGGDSPKGGGIPTPGGTTPKGDKTTTQTNTHTSTGGASNTKPTSKMGKLKGGLKGAPGAFGKVLPALGMVAGGIDLVGSMFTGDKEGAGGALGGLGGTYGGATLGGTIGTAIMPGIGTAIGSGIGGTLGYLGGTKVGQGLVSQATTHYTDENGKEKAVNFAKNGAEKTGDYGLVGKMFGWGKDDGNGWLFDRKDKKSKGKGGGGGAGGSGDMELTDLQQRELNKNNQLNLNNTGSPGNTSMTGRVSLQDSLDQGGKQDSGKGKKQKVTQMDVERLREKNVNKETENLTTFWNALNRFGQLIQDAKTIDFGTGTGGADSGSDSGESASSIGGKGKEKIWKFLKAKGLSDDQASAIMGNLQQESNLDPNAVNGDSGAFGIAQWLGSRKTGLDSFAKSKGKKSNDLDVQLDYLWKEMSSGYDSDMLKQAGWGKNASLEKNANAFAYGFERMGKDEAMMSTRISNAKSFKSQFGGSGRGGGGGADWDSTITSLNPTVAQQDSGGSTTNNDNRNYTVNVSVSGTSDPDRTAQATADKIGNLLRGSDSFFANEHTRK